MLHPFAVRGALAAACLSALAAAHADDTDVDVFGPSSRSSIALFDVASSYHADEVLDATGQTQGALKTHDNMAVLQGVYALTPRVNLVGALRSHLSNDQSFSFGPFAGSTQNTGIGDSLGASAWVAGHPAQRGFAVAASVATARDPGTDARFSMQAQPQYRIDDSWLVGGAIGVQDLPGYGGGNAYASLHVGWRPTARWSVVPSLSVYHYVAAHGYGSFDNRELGVSVTCHVDKHWAVSAEAMWLDQSDRTTDVFANDLRNGRGASGDVGLRYSF
jgi:hypothetical protein